MATGLAQRLLDWFQRHGRHDLPWQNPQTPYRVWVSEIMLQQTQVATVLGYFERFMRRFPDVQTLAQAPSDEVMQYWAGLGYYARARNMHAAARRIVDEHGGELPDNAESLRALPGIGESTAGAILSLAFGRPAAILDGNCKRVYARYFGEPGWPGETRIARRLWAYARQHTPADRPGDFAQAIMDLGATLCTRKKPDCRRCPLNADCRALAEDAVECYPYPRPKKQRPLRQARLLAVMDDDRVLLEKRPPSGIWGSLWSLPEIGEGFTAEDHARQMLGLQLEDARPLESFTHGFTHFELQITPWIGRKGQSAGVADEARLRWYSLARLPGVPAPVAKFLANLPTRNESS